MNSDTGCGSCLIAFTLLPAEKSSRLTRAELFTDSRQQSWLQSMSSGVDGTRGRATEEGFLGEGPGYLSRDQGDPVYRLWLCDSRRLRGFSSSSNMVRATGDLMRRMTAIPGEGMVPLGRAIVAEEYIRVEVIR